MSVDFENSEGSLLRNSFNQAFREVVVWALHVSSFVTVISNRCKSFM